LIPRVKLLLVPLVKQAVEGTGGKFSSTELIPSAVAGPDGFLTPDRTPFSKKRVGVCVSSQFFSKAGNAVERPRTAAWDQSTFTRHRVPAVQTARSPGKSRSGHQQKGRQENPAPCAIIYTPAYG
jgi:hypothetical protein